VQGERCPQQAFAHDGSGILDPDRIEAAQGRADAVVEVALLAVQSIFSIHFRPILALTFIDTPTYRAEVLATMSHRRSQKSHQTRSSADF
jgi:hypothetical protein